jgi:hypothetical protein
MSSIYKKGRDGYFYYQAYLRNHITGKKDKRVFHSLGTKNREEAERKQREYDKRYAKKNQRRNKLYLNKYFKIFLASFIIIVFLIKFYLNTETKIIKESNFSIAKNIDFTDSLYSVISKDSIEDLENINKEFLEKETKIKKTIDPDTVFKQDKSTIEIPDFDLIRVETIASIFSQGKIYITVDKNHSENNLLFLCRKVRNEYKNFKNIIICIYLNSKVGKQLAKGIRSEISIEEKNKAWIALYSYNKVEGEYFDNNPSSYNNF